MELEVISSGLDVQPMPLSLGALPFSQTVRQNELEAFARYKGAEYVVVIGQGGSVNSIRSLAHCLASPTQIAIVDTQDPFRLASLKSKVAYSCMILPISKSGNTLSVLQSTLYFNGLPALYVTGKKGALYDMAQRLGADIAQHPPVGGRFIGATLPGLLPAYLAGMDTAAIIAGAQACYLDQDAVIQVAQFLYEAEKKGYADVYMPIYDYRLSGFKELIMQLCHETYCKKGKGQTVLALDAPESQHHTNQRYFGGPRNMVGVYVSVRDAQSSSSIFVPDSCKSINIDDKPLSGLHELSHQSALHAELQGVIDHAQHNNMPYVHLTLDKVDEYHVGYFMAFWQLVAVAGARLRDVDPYDQPEVEFAKDVTRSLLLR